MAKLLFANSYFYKFDRKQWETRQPYPPLGTLYAASCMRQAGHSVSLFDSNLADSVEDIIPFLKKTSPRYLIIYDDGFNYLTKMCLSKMREAAFQLIKTGKEYGCKVVVSGSDSTDQYDIYLGYGADVIIMGEGEVTLEEVIAALESGSRDYSEIKGVAFRSHGVTLKTPKREIITDLDRLPVPAWDLVEMEKYRKIWNENHGYFSLNLATTRGCPFRCNWCAKPIYGNRYNSRSPVKVADEIEYLLKEFRPDHFWFCDDIFGLKPGWVNEFRNIVKKRKLNFRYKIQTRVDLILNENNLGALCESGLETVWIGAESGSQKILDAMEKGTTIDQIYRATKLLKSKNIRIAFFIQLGYPGETKEDVRMTTRMIGELLPDDIGISVSYPLPGTKFYENVKEDLKLKANWTDSDDLAMMFRNSFQPAYYKRLHHFIHRFYRQRKAVSAAWKLVRNPFDQRTATLKTALSFFYYLPQTIFDLIILKQLKSSGK